MMIQSLVVVDVSIQGTQVTLESMLYRLLSNLDYCMYDTISIEFLKGIRLSVSASPNFPSPNFKTRPESY